MAEFFFFAALMTVLTIVFAVMSACYKYAQHERAFELTEDTDNIMTSSDLQDTQNMAVRSDL